MDLNQNNYFEKEEYIGKLTYYNIILNETLTVSCNNINCDLCFDKNTSFCIICNVFFIFEEGVKYCFNNNINEDMEVLRKELINGNLDHSINELNNEQGTIIIEDNNIKYEITTTNNYNEYKNISIIKLGECEKKLKEKYNIGESEPLIILKVDIYEEGLLNLYE